MRFRRTLKCGNYFWLKLSLISASCANHPSPASNQDTQVVQSTAAPFTLAPSSMVPPSPTVMYAYDFSRFDPDLYQPIDVSHNPPLIAGADETVKIVFDFANLFCMEFPICCLPGDNLFVTYGNSEAYQNIPLRHGIENGVDALIAELPATDEAGQALRYYLEVSVPQAGYSQRYPAAGTIDLYAASAFIPVELPEQKPVAEGDIVYDLFWGFGPDKVRQATYDWYPQRIGPPALDVASDGRIALMDPVNERVILFDPAVQSYESFTLPFPCQMGGDLQFDREGNLTLLDMAGQEGGESTLPIPHVYRLGPDGSIKADAPVYAKFALRLIEDYRVLDGSDEKLIVPFNSQGEINSRETQRQKQTWEYPYRFVEGAQGLDPYLARFADVQAGLAYQVHSASPLGSIMDFARTPQGHVMVFYLGDHIRAVWVNRSGVVLKDVSLPNGQYSGVNFDGQVAVGEDGSHLC